MNPRSWKMIYLNIFFIQRSTFFQILKWHIEYYFKKRKSLHISNMKKQDSKKLITVFLDIMQFLKYYSIQQR